MESNMKKKDIFVILFINNEKKNGNMIQRTLATVQKCQWKMCQKMEYHNDFKKNAN